MRAPRFVFATALCGLGIACAPVQSSTHFQRWDTHSAKLKAEAPPSDEAAPTVSTTPVAAPAPTPAATSAVVYGTGGGETPAITATSSASRVIRPGDAPASTDDDDAIY